MYPYEYQDVGDVIKWARRARKLAQSELASRLQTRANTTAVTGTVISCWERGVRIPGPYWRAHLASELGIAREQLDYAAVVARRNRSNPPEEQQ